MDGGKEASWRVSPRGLAFSSVVARHTNEYLTNLMFVGSDNKDEIMTSTK